jgi:hypothetical protein
MRKPKYFYVPTSFPKKYWVDVREALEDADFYQKFIGGKHWPFTRDEARKCLVRDGTSFIYQFENKPPYKFIKQVR